jgi:hypothetical protein
MTSLLLRIITQGHSVTLMTHKWTPNSFVSTTRLLHRYSPATAIVSVTLTLWLGGPEPTLVAAVVWVAAAGAATNAEEPEERSRPREDDTEPHDDHCFTTELELNAVRV